MCDQIEAKACALFPCVILATAVADYADLGRLTAQKRDGRTAAAGTYAAKAKLTSWKLGSGSWSVEPDLKHLSAKSGVRCRDHRGR
jgi:hypothetical protein